MGGGRREWWERETEREGWLAAGEGLAAVGVTGDGAGRWGLTRDGFVGLTRGWSGGGRQWTGAIFGLVLFLRLCERSKVGIRVSAASRNIFFGRRPLRERELEFGAEE